MVGGAKLFVYRLFSSPSQLLVSQHCILRLMLWFPVASCEQFVLNGAPESPLLRGRVAHVV